MSIFKELATLEERIEKDSKRKDEILSEISSLINKGKEVAGNWDWGCDGPLKLITNEEVLSLLRPISNSLCRLPDMMDAGGNRYIKMSLVQDYRWRAIW